MSKERIKLTPDLLRTIRRVYGLNQIEFSKKASLSYSYYVKLEQETLPITSHLEIKMRQALGLTDEQLEKVKSITENPLV